MQSELEQAVIYFRWKNGKPNEIQRLSPKGWIPSSREEVRRELKAGNAIWMNPSWNVQVQDVN